MARDGTEGSYCKQSRQNQRGNVPQAKLTAKVPLPSACIAEGLWHQRLAGGGPRLVTEQPVSRFEFTVFS